MEMQELNFSYMNFVKRIHSLLNSLIHTFIKTIKLIILILFKNLLNLEV